MHKYNYILFDLDGTITDSGPGIMNAAQHALNSFGIEEKSIDKLKLFVGPPLDKSFTERYGFSNDDAWKAVGVFREYYNVTGIFENSVYPGIEALLDKLTSQGFIIAIASSKPQILIHRVLKHFDLEKYFDVVVGCELDGKRSDKSEVIDEVLRQLSEIAVKRGLIYDEGSSQTELTALVKERAVMVGDRCYDVEGAHSFSLPCIGVLYGYGTRQEMEESGADYIAETVEDIADFL